MERAKGSGWQNTFLEIGDARAAGFYQSLGQPKGETTWEGRAIFVQLLCDPYLHRTGMLSGLQSERSSLLEVNLSVEALALNDGL